MQPTRHLANIPKPQNLLSNPNGSHSHASANAHGRDTNLLLASLKLIEKRRDLAGAGAAERVTESNSTTLGVNLLLGNAKLVGAPQALAGESLVDLEDVNIVGRDAGEVKSLGDGLPGALAHEEGLDADNRGGDVLAQNLLAKLLGDITAHEEDGGGAIGDLAGIAGVDAAVGGKGGAELAQGLSSDARADTLILLDGDLLSLTRLEVLVLDGQGSNLVVEETGLLGLEGLLVRGSGESVLGSAGDLEVLGHVLRQLTHGDLAVGRFFEVLKVLGEFADGVGAVVKRFSLCIFPREIISYVPVVQAHALNTGANANVDHASADLVGDVNAGLETRRALAVERADGSRLGETSVQAGGAHLGSATAGSQDGSDGDVLDEGGVDLGALNDGLEDASHQVGGGGILESALATAGEGSAASGGDNNIVRSLFEELLLTASGRVAGELATKLR